MTPKKEVKEETTVTTEKKKEIQFMKNLYGDFKGTMGEVFGDAKETWFKHKVLIIIAFVAFLIYRNKFFSIEGFVKKLEERLKGDRDW